MPGRARECIDPSPETELPILLQHGKPPTFGEICLFSAEWMKLCSALLARKSRRIYNSETLSAILFHYSRTASRDLLSQHWSCTKRFVSCGLRPRGAAAA